MRFRVATALRLEGDSIVLHLITKTQPASPLAEEAPKPNSPKPQAAGLMLQPTRCVCRALHEAIMKLSSYVLMGVGHDPSRGQEFDVHLDFLSLEVPTKIWGHFQTAFQ